VNKLFYGDNLDVLRGKIKDESVDLCYIDPPFNSKRNYNQIYNNIGGDDRAQAQAFTDTWIWDAHAVAGFSQILANDGNRFTSQTIELIKGLHKVLKEGSLLAYLVHMTLRIVEIHRVLKPTGSFYLHCDPTSSHYLKLVIDGIFVAGGGFSKRNYLALSALDRNGKTLSKNA
jgi:DNA modification methylase